ncbi:macrophage mannose receptor 1-like [Physella acuta]|uniref:macrophage mannose receptor 1-like n=1 Tax=Physella acuta TaxID=109671 RepID=UPI0027DBC353|nr:macrophage mannose receptor 1-like [Physella acuta]
MAASLVFLVISTLVYLGSCATIDDCPAGVPRDRYLQVRGDTCYQFVVYRHNTHTAARAYCEQHGGSLVLVKSVDVQEYLYDQLVNNFKVSGKIWIGLNDLDTENLYQWEDGTTPVYTDWAGGEGPASTSYTHTANHNTRDCVVIDLVAGGKWKETNCESGSFLILFSTSESHSYVCQYMADVEEQTPPPFNITVSSTSELTHPCPPFSCDLGCSTFVIDNATRCPLCECST